MIRFVILDDHPIVMDAIDSLAQADPRLKCTGKATNLDELRQLAVFDFDVLVLDMHLKEIRGITLFKMVREIIGETPILVYSMASENAFINLLVRNGARGFVNKGEPTKHLLDAVLSVAAGKTVFPSWFVEPDHQEHKAPRKFDQLSDRERQIFLLTVEGVPGKEIATLLNLSSSAVSTYLFRIREKLELNSPYEFARLAIQEGLIDPTDGSERTDTESSSGV